MLTVTATGEVVLVEMLGPGEALPFAPDVSIAFTLNNVDVPLTGTVTVATPLELVVA